jgi:Bacterial protein of unknown function (DUF885)
VTAANWISRSDALAEPVVALYTLAEPELSSQLGLTQADARTTDLSEGWRERVAVAADAASARLTLAAATETEPRVREDIAILQRAVDDVVRGIAVSDANEVPFVDVARTVFMGLRVLLDEQNPPERMRLALVRLRRYAGFDDLPPLAASAERESRERLAVPGLLPPYERQLRTALGLAPVLLEGIEQMLRAAQLSDWEAPFAALRTQLEAYDAFVTRELLPRARTDHRLPAEVYAFNLHRVGVDIPPAELAAHAHAAFDEIAAEMQRLAPQVAAAKGFASNDYREVVRMLKREQIVGGADAIVAFYRARLAQIETIVRREQLVTLPEREARIRVASLAESAEMPVAHMNPPPLVGNTGQAGEFVLPLDVPPAPGGAANERSDDFTHDAVTWTLVAHEARPGHELQFDRMLGGGLSLARAVFAFNSVNVEGWALYTEAMMLPYMPPEGQLCSLLMRLHRAARAFLDPELQSGAITPDEAQAFLEREIVYSPTFARSEVERYTFRAPGQATSYFYGYTKLVALRSEAEALLGARFAPLAFHDFVVDQGLVPPDALRSAVLERFVPSVTV